MVVSIPISEWGGGSDRPAGWCYTHNVYERLIELEEKLEGIRAPPPSPPLPFPPVDSELHCE
jgi:hypothetical protein